MRILCLHGQGASSTIFETQLSRLVSALPPHWTLDFVDAPIECGPGLNISGVYPGPYYCFFESYTPERMSDAVEFVREIVEEDGPYDAIFGFSQGASVAAAYLTAYSSGGQGVSPISFATFFCTALIPPSIAAKTDKLEESVGSLIGPSGLPIPTVHILGTKDLCFGQSVKLLESCEGKGSSEFGSQPSSTDSTPSVSSSNLASYFSPGLTQPVYFQGGHDVPKDATTVTKMRNAVEHAARIAFLG